MSRIVREQKRPLIVTKGLCRGYAMGNERVIALRNVDLTFYEGEICCIFGASGSGKSSVKAPASMSPAAPMPQSR